MPHQFRHTPPINGRWSMLAYNPGQPQSDVEYDFRAKSESAARKLAQFEAAYQHRSHFKLRSPAPEGRVIFDGPVKGVGA